MCFSKPSKPQTPAMQLSKLALLYNIYFSIQAFNKQILTWLNQNFLEIKKIYLAEKRVCAERTFVLKK